MTYEELVAEEKRWQQNKPLLKREIKLAKDKEKVQKLKNDKRQLTTTKLLLLFLFLNFTLIEIFTGWVTIQSIQLAYYSEYSSPDYTPLVTLIGAVVGEVMSFATYALKSMKENSQGGIVYETALREPEPQNDDGSVG